MNEDDRPFTTSEDHRVVTLTLTRDLYVPLAVWKTFVKMALSVMLDDEFAIFGETREWLMGGGIGGEFLGMPSAEWMVATSTPTYSFVIHLLTQTPKSPDQLPSLLAAVVRHPAVSDRARFAVLGEPTLKASADMHRSISRPAG